MRRALTDEQAQQIRQLVKMGILDKKGVAKQYNVSLHVIQSIIEGRCYVG